MGGEIGQCGALGSGWTRVEGQTQVSLILARVESNPSIRLQHFAQGYIQEADGLRYLQGEWITTEA